VNAGPGGRPGPFGLNPRRISLVARVVAGCLLFGACAEDFLWAQTMGKKPKLVTTTTTTTTTTVTTVTTMPPPPPPPPPPRPAAPKPVAKPKPPPPPPPPPPPAPAPPPVDGAGESPLTGYGSGVANMGHPALVVKIDNVHVSLKQAGLNEADLVFEEGVEGGITRFAAVFHSKNSDPVGPIRSARSTDVGLVTPLIYPLFSYSGANDVFKAYVRSSALVDVGVENFPGHYYREQSRKAPNNLFSHTSRLFALAKPDAAGPPAFFSYRAPGEAPSGPGIKPVSSVEGSWNRQNGQVRTPIRFDWDPGANGWFRTQNGALHLDAHGRRITPNNVIFQFTPYRNTGLVDSSGAEVPEAEVVGDGEAWIMTGGHLIPARWSKQSKEAITRYLDADGNEVKLHPGRTWVELIPPGNGRFTERPPDPIAPPPPPPTEPPPPADPPPPSDPPPSDPPPTDPPPTEEAPSPPPEEEPGDELPVPPPDSPAPVPPGPGSSGRKVRRRPAPAGVGLRRRRPRRPPPPARSG
jgi:hypothetical protein